MNKLIKMVKTKNKEIISCEMNKLIETPEEYDQFDKELEEINGRT